MQFKVRYQGAVKCFHVEQAGEGPAQVLRLGGSVLLKSVNFSRLVADARNVLGINLLK